MERRDYRLAAIVYTDIKGFSKYMENDESSTIANLQKHNAVLYEIFASCGGEVIKTIGDAFLAHFSNTLNAVKAGIMIQERMNDLRMAKDGFDFHLRIGIHLGDIHFYENDALGEGINIASRLQSICRPDHLCVSGEVYNQISNKLEVPVRSIGKVELKNISREISAYELMGNGEEPRENNASFTRPTSERPQESKEGNRENEGMDFSFEGFKDMAHSFARGFKMRGPMGRGMRMPRPPMPSWMRMPGFMDQENDQSSSFSFLNIKSRTQNFKDKLGKRPSKPLRLVEDYKKMIHTNTEKSARALLINGIGYGSVGALLLMINLLTGFSTPWFLYPVFSYLPIFLLNLARAQSFSDSALDLNVAGNINEKNLQVMMDFHRLKKEFRHHSYFSGGIMVLLTMINIMTTPYPFAAIVLAVLGPIWMAHLAVTVISMKDIFSKLKRFLGDRVNFLFSKRSDRKKAFSSVATDNNAQVDPVIRDMEQIREKIFSIIKSKNFKDNEHTRGIEPVLDRFINEVKAIRKQSSDITLLISEISVNSFDAELKSLENKRSISGSDALKNEYSRSIAEVEKNRDSVAGLNEQKEMLELKVKSAVNSVKQLHINLARMSSYSANTDADKMDILANKTKELDTYLDDLEASYRELKSF